ncbi:MAG: D-alanyl-D-alanine carboxypeptidase family protein, partial [Deltaproteobacteria bacterium]|nr:D-alanyl-D-alanine carboxypeptidase family protein [Kofleriaceae bacterium]
MASLSHGLAWLVALLVATCARGASRAPAPVTPAPRAGWVDVSVRIPDAVIDMRYATADNFTGTVLYPVARCLVRAEVAERLAAAADTLRAQGHRLVFWDCYRPASIQRELWRRVPDRRYVAEPTFDDTGTPVGGSKHSRGAAVDVSLADRAG